MIKIVENYDYAVVNSYYPRIGQAIVFLWGQPEFITYVNNLLTDTRDGKRQGFPGEVAPALLRLSMLHDQEYPQYVKDDNDLWRK